MSGQMLTGGCLCGGVRYEVTEPPNMMGYCHCSRCRRWTGARSSTEIVVLREWLRVTQGEDLLGDYMNRNFCTTCGSTVFWGYSLTNQPFYGFGAGTLDDGMDPGIRPAAHGYVASKAAWAALADDLPKIKVEDMGDLYAPHDPAVLAAPLGPPPSPEHPIAGMCFCERVRYELVGPLVDLTHCHCSKCRRWTGGSFATVGTVHRDHLRILSGWELLTAFCPAPTDFRNFCGHCGSCLFGGPLDDPSRELLGVSMGTIIGDPGHRPDGHIFVDSKAPWHDITDDLPQFQKGRSDG